ncbi:MAG: response regulator [Eubacterium sp.]|nr:response regulator [Eubacterium sp.]
MKSAFSHILKEKRNELGISQEMLAGELFVTKSTVARWESGSRLPDAPTIAKIADCLDVDVALLINATIQDEKEFNIIMVDDNKAILLDGISVLKEVVPNATITGFNWPQEAIEYAKENKVSLAILDIELGIASGLDLCRTLLDINSNTNVVYLTAYPDYSLDAWDTGANGFLLKPLTPESVREQLVKLRYPFVPRGEKE